MKQTGTLKSWISLKRALFLVLVQKKDAWHLKQQSLDFRIKAMQLELAKNKLFDGNKCRTRITGWDTKDPGDGSRWRTKTRRWRKSVRKMKKRRGSFGKEMEDRRRVWENEKKNTGQGEDAGRWCKEGGGLFRRTVCIFCLCPVYSNIPKIFTLGYVDGQI